MNRFWESLAEVWVNVLIIVGLALLVCSVCWFTIGTFALIVTWEQHPYGWWQLLGTLLYWTTMVAVLNMEEANG